MSRVPNGRTPPAAPSWSLATITSATKKLPTRILLHSIPKWGKTSFACHAPRPIFLMSKGEDGLLTLKDAGLVPASVECFPTPFEKWGDVKKALHALATEPHEYRTLVIDTINGMEKLCHEHTCEVSFDGDWTNFNAYGSGERVALAEWGAITIELDKCRAKGMGIILLCHSAVKLFNNPTGVNYDRWEPTLSKGSWAHLDRWCDMILFGTHDTVVISKEKQVKGKAKGGITRTLMTERCAAFDAGNRLGLPSEIDCPSAEEAWGNLMSAMKGDK